MNSIFKSIIDDVSYLDFNANTVLLYVGIIVTSVILFYIIDTPWRKRRNAEVARQKARDTAMLESLKAKTALNKKTKYTKKYEQYLLSKQARHDEMRRKSTMAFAKRLQKEHRRQVNIEKRITEEALYRAEIQRQALKEVLGEKQAALTKIDIESIKSQIRKELLAAEQYTANRELTDNIIDAVCAPRIGIMLDIC